MDTILNQYVDIYKYLFGMLPISDKRLFLRTCIAANKLSIYMPNVESLFQKMIIEQNFIGNLAGLYFPLFKYTVELLYDNHIIPNKYVIPENEILFEYDDIYAKLAERGNFSLIKKLSKMDKDYKISTLEHVIKGAARSGNMKILKWGQKKIAIPEEAISEAIQGNHLDVIKWLLKNNGQICNGDIKYAAKNGNKIIFKFILKKSIYHSCCYEACYSAAQYGHLDLVQYCFQIDAVDKTFVADGAAHGGQLDILKFAYQQGYKLSSKFRCNHIHIYEWLIQNNLFSYNITIAANIAAEGGLKCLQFIHSKGYNVRHKTVFSKAIESENIDIIMWLHDIGCERVKQIMFLPNNTVLKLLLKWYDGVISQKVFHIAAQCGDIDTLKILYEDGYPIDNQTIHIAVEYGHLHIIIWAREIRYMWTEKTCKKAAAFGRLKLLKWLRGIDRNDCELISSETEICPWNSDVCYHAIIFNHYNVLKFAIENGCSVGSRCYKMTRENKSYRNLIEPIIAKIA